jgi:DNA-binding response OmpR family regulator
VPPSSQSSGTASHRNILLLEEYDALAAAIGSALKKFAPQHATSVARSLREAEKLAAKIGPELFVIDVDPPWLGLTEFLEKMRTAHPDARALVVGAAIPAEIAAERGSFGALQFISKPFELAAFGAAVQAVLGPWRESESAIPRGSLGALNPMDVILLHCGAGASVIVELSANAKRSGKIHIAEGEIVHAATGALTGVEALREILSWPDARITEAKASRSTQHTIERNWVTVFVKALRDAKAKQTPKIAPPEKVPVAEPRVRTGKKIVAIDDTEMLLIFVEDVLATADPELQITTALTGSDGIKEVERVVPDLVLLDYSLPDLNGDEVCERLLQDERMAGVPVLMMSGHVAEMAATAQRFENVVATIEKPFLSDALVQLVQKTLAAAPRKRPAAVKRAPAPPAEAIALPKEAPKPAQDQQPPPVAEPSPPFETPLAPAISESPAPPEPTLPTVRVDAPEANDAVLRLFLEVVAMQVTPELQMGTIRAKPASFTVSLHLPSTARRVVGPEVGFQLGATQLEQDGRLSSLRLVPTSKTFQPPEIRKDFEISAVSVIPNAVRTRVQFAPAGATPMTMELLAHVELAAVELSPTFQVAQLVLKWPTNLVRVTLNPTALQQRGAKFEVASVKLDNAARIAELLLHPVK